jgi:predicted DNA-binding transcriptional regulator AlpA
MKSDRFLNLRDLRALLGISDSTINRWQATGKLPKSVDIGITPHQQTRRWLASEVEATSQLSILPPEDSTDRYLGIQEVKEKIGVSHSTLTRWRTKGHFPGPVQNTGTKNC